jgi:hypothetical protein
MRARAELVGAVLRIGGRAPHGTRVECVLEGGARPAGRKAAPALPPSLAHGPRDQP